MRKRWLAGPLRSALAALPVVVLTGARQTGKTTLALALPEPRTFLSLDDLGVLDQAQKDPDALLVSCPVTVYEVQRAPEILPPIKRRVDRQRAMVPSVGVAGAEDDERMELCGMRKAASPPRGALQDRHPTPTKAMTTLPRSSLAVVGPAVRVRSGPGREERGCSQRMKTIPPSPEATMASNS